MEHLDEARCGRMKVPEQLNNFETYVRSRQLE